jgi:hypothetical protein
MARTHAKAISAAGGRLVAVYDVVESAAKCAAAGTPPPVNAIDGLRASYLADAAGASLRLGKHIELKDNCEVTWSD